MRQPRWWASEAIASVPSAMIEAHSGEVEKVLLYVADARDRARKAADQLAADGAPGHVTQALRDSEQELAALHRRLTQSTFYAVDDDALKLAV
jgi:hypothetical protein